MSPMGHSEVRGKSEISDVKSPSSSFDPDARVERPQGEAARGGREFSADERVGEFRGGSYQDVYVKGLGDRIEVHHVPSNEANGLRFEDGPCIAMDKEDHRKTASWGMATEAKNYRAQQADLISEGKFKEALKLDIDDLRNPDKFEPGKYDKAIQEMLDYAESKGYISDQKGLLND